MLVHDALRTPFVRLKARNIAFTDTETGGLDPYKTPILELAVVVTTPDASKILEEWCTKIWPVDLSTCESEALRVNKFEERGGQSTWEKEGISLEAAIQKFDTMTKECVIAGHNVKFDLDYLKEAYIKVGRYRSVNNANPTPLMSADYHTIDTCSVVWPFLIKDPELRTISMDSIRKALGWTTAGSHSALTDAKDSLRVFKWALNALPSLDKIKEAAILLNTNPVTDEATGQK